MDVTSVDELLTTTRAVRKRLDLTRPVGRDVNLGSFLLALRSRGLGSVWTAMHLAKEREVAELLGVPATVTQAALFPVAYTIGTDSEPAARPATEAITFWNTWGER